MIFWDRSPWATAVATWAMLRTCAVRLPAIRFTESVRSFQVPATPGTCACPPSRPSLPTSRATRVTSDANADSWSTIVLIVVFSSSISPRTSTVILRLRSPRATPAATEEMSRTWAVRLPAIRFTESVRSFQVPATPGTCACPPSRPSVPTSRATRVTSDAKMRKVKVIELIVSASSAISPCALTIDRCDRSPSATAARTRLVSTRGRVRPSMSLLAASTAACQSPPPRACEMRSSSTPSLATAPPTRTISSLKRWLASAISLNTVQISATTSSPVTGARFRKSPACTARIAARSRTRLASFWPE